MFTVFFFIQPPPPEMIRHAVSTMYVYGSSSILRYLWYPKVRRLTDSFIVLCEGNCFGVWSPGVPADRSCLEARSIPRTIHMYWIHLFSPGREVDFTFFLFFFLPPPLGPLPPPFLARHYRYDDTTLKITFAFLSSVPPLSPFTCPRFAWEDGPMGAVTRAPRKAH